MAEKKDRNGESEYDEDIAEQRHFHSIRIPI